MKPATDRILLMLLLIIFLVVTIFLFRSNQSSLKTVEQQLDTLQTELEQMSFTTRVVINGMQQSLEMMENVSANLASSSQQLGELLRSAKTITSEEKKKIREAIEDIEETRLAIEAERKKALLMMQENTALNDEE